MKRKLRINGHSHLLPYPEEIPQFMKDKEIFWVDDERKYMLQKGWSRPVTHSSFFLDEKLEWMEKNKREVEPVARSCMYQAAVKVIV